LVMRPPCGLDGRRWVAPPLKSMQLLLDNAQRTQRGLAGC